MTKNAYIHIPFCLSKCNYCAFVSFTDRNLVESYISALMLEIDKRYCGEKLNTLYLGGGTPSLLSPAIVKNLIGKFNFADLAEITFEANPNDLTLNYLTDLKIAGVNRLSIGAQSFNDDVLKLCARRHTSSEVAKACAFARQAGVDNISIDLIYGLPKQCFKDDLDKAVALEPEHISLYGLKVEEGTQFAKSQVVTDGDEQADLYLAAVEFLKQNGYEHYEVSNFSQKGFESRHNLNYWNNNSYYGFGVAAHGYENDLRYANTNDLSKYIKGDFRKTEHALLSKEQLEEEIFLGFRRMSGLDKTLIDKKFGINFDAKYEKVLKKYLESGHILRTEKGYKLSLEGVLLSNIILSEFLD